MAELSTLLIRKKGVVYDTKNDFGYATGEIPFPADVEVKELTKRNCPCEDGDRVFFPDRLALASYDLEIEFKYQGKESSLYIDFCRLRDLLTGADGEGTELAIYSPWYRIGRQRVHLKNIKPDSSLRMNDESFQKIKITFCITDPVTDILLSK